MADRRPEGRRSKVSRLPAAVRGELERLLIDGATIDELVAHLRSLAVDDVSRSAVGRWRREEAPALQGYYRIRAMAEGWREAIGDDADSPLGQMLIESLRAAAMIATDRLHSAPDEIDDAAIGRLSRAIKDLATASKVEVDRGRALLARVRETLEAATPDGAAPARLDPAEALRRIRVEVYGIHDDGAGA